RSIGRNGTRFADGLPPAASTRRRSTCCRGSPKSDTCQPVGRENPHPDPSPQGGEDDSRELASRGDGESSPSCPFCKSKDTEVISLFGSQVMTMQCKCRT